MQRRAEDGEQRGGEERGPRPNSRAVVAHSATVAPSMKARDRIRAAVRPPTLSASAPIGG